MRGKRFLRFLSLLLAVSLLMLCGCGSDDTGSLVAIATEAADVLIPELSGLAARLDAALPSDAEVIRNDILSAANAAEKYAAKAAVCRCSDEKLKTAVTSYLTSLQDAASGLLETEEELFSCDDPLQSKFRLSVFQSRCTSEFPALANDIILYSSLSKNGKKAFDFSNGRSDDSSSVLIYAVEQISPSLYEAMDAVVLVYGIAPKQGAAIRVDCEIPGLTKPLSELFELSPRGSVLRILPERLESCEAGEKEIRISVTDTATGKICASGTFSVNVDKLSGFALRDDRFGRITCDDLKFFLRPEDGFVLDLATTAADYQSLLAGSGDVSLRAKLTAVQCAVSDAGVRLRKGAETFSADELPDTILLPAEIRALGTCSLLDIALLETGVLQSENMEPTLILLDSGLFLAVRDSDGTVYLMDPAVLPVTTAAVDRVVRMITSDDYEVLRNTAYAVVEIN